MSDKDVVDTPEDTPDTEQSAERPEIEIRAMHMGWRPKEEFDGEEDDFIDAKEFVRRQPLFDKIETQNKQIKAVSKALEALKGHYTKVEQAAVEKAILQMKSARKDALSNGDGDRFELLDDEIKKAETQLTEIQKVQETPLVEEPVDHPEWRAFQSRNPWYNTTGYMRKYADEVGAMLAQKGMSPVEVLKEVEKAVRKEFPNKFVNPNKESAPDVDTSRKVPTKPRGVGDENKLSDNQKKIMNDLVRQGVLTKEQYIADLKAIGELK